MGFLPRKPSYDEALAERVRQALGPAPGVTEKKMFGGLAFMVDGHMACGIVKADLMVRVGPDQFEDALAQPGARPMDFTGRPMRGMVYVDKTALEAQEALARWVGRGTAYARALAAGSDAGAEASAEE